MQDLLRFLLALIVVIFHYKHFAIQSALSLPPDDYLAPWDVILNPIYAHGYYAVDVFFYLSGYMLASNLRSDTDYKFNYGNFLIKRLARIYPAHATSLLAMGLLAIIVDRLSLQPFITYNDDVPNFFASIFLLNGIGIMRDTSFNLPSWSLSVEFICYVIFGCICASPLERKATVFFFGLLIGVVINELTSDPNIRNVGSGMVFFFAGTIAAVKFKAWSDRLLKHNVFAVILFFALCLLSFTASFRVNLGIQKLIWVFVSLPSLVILITAVDEKLDRIIRPRPFLWFGLISFSIYIWHFPVQAVLHYLTSGIQIDEKPFYNSTLLFWLYLGTVVVVSHLSLITIEKWGSSFIRSHERNR